jgi:uroporphyrinogen decarboxylase
LIDELGHRERVFKSLNHQKPDRTPVDDSWTAQIRSDTWEKLKNHLRLQDDEDVRRRLRFDFRYACEGQALDFIKDHRSAFVPAPFPGYYRKTPDGLLEDEWGVMWKPNIDGLFWRYAIHPLAKDEALDSYEFPSLGAAGRWEEAESSVKRFKDEYVINAFMHKTLFETAWGLRGFSAFLTDLLTRPSYANRLLDRLLEYRMEEGERFLEIGADIIQLGDDLGTQERMMISPDIWRRYFKPRMKTLIDHLKKHAQSEVHFFYHTDGFAEPVIPELIEIGIDILNPVQPESMQPEKIKKAFGDKLILWGTISVQKTLPFGSVQEVGNEVTHRIRTCGYDGGLVIAPTHSPLPDCPPENIVTMYDTAVSTRL